jgi:hypothetical protein
MSGRLGGEICGGRKSSFRAEPFWRAGGSGYEAVFAHLRDARSGSPQAHCMVPKLDVPSVDTSSLLGEYPGTGSDQLEGVLVEAASAAPLAWRSDHGPGRTRSLTQWAIGADHAGLCSWRQGQPSVRYPTSPTDPLARAGAAVALVSRWFPREPRPTSNRCARAHGSSWPKRSSQGPRVRRP